MTYAEQMDYELDDARIFAAENHVDLSEFADGAPVTDADRAEAWASRDAGECRTCGGSGVVSSGGYPRECPECVY